MFLINLIQKIIYFFKTKIQYNLFDDKLYFYNNIFFREDKTPFHIIEISPQNIKSIEIKYGKNIYSTKNKKIKKVQDIFIPLKFSFIFFLYERERDHDIFIKIIDIDDREFNREIKCDDKNRLEGWYKELYKTLK